MPMKSDYLMYLSRKREAETKIGEQVLFIRDMDISLQIEGFIDFTDIGVQSSELLISATHNLYRT